MSIVFEHPRVLYLLWLLPAWWLLVWPRAGGGVLFTRGEVARRIARASTTRAGIVLLLPRILRTMALASGIVALAHPVRVLEIEEVRTPGKGISLALDVSSSMLAEDMGEGRRRIDVAREAAVRFARGRVHDELSLVAFAGESVTRVPPTTDRNLIVHGVESLDVHLVRDGSDVAQAVLAAVTQLMDSERDPRVVVLLSDGAHNGVRIPPMEAARAAQSLGVRVHGISILGPEQPGRPGPFGGRVPGTTALEGVASVTGGRYFRASTAAAVDSIYREIDALEASEEEVRVREERRSRRALFLFLGLLLLGGEVALRGSRWGVVP